MKDTFEYIENLKPNKLIIRKEFYLDKSNFEKFYGFKLNGKLLTLWLYDRIHQIKKSRDSVFIADYFKGTLSVDPSFFELSTLQRVLVLIHEARHADGVEFKHIPCPSNFKFLSIRRPDVKLENLDACDSESNGCYGFTASFVFEMISYGLYDHEVLVGIYNSEVSRILDKNKN
jgi:hypothetical protein